MAPALIVPEMASIQITVLGVSCSIRSSLSSRQVQERQTLVLKLPSEEKEREPFVFCGERMQYIKKSGRTVHPYLHKGP